MEKHWNINNWFSIGWMYSAFQDLVGSRRGREWLAKHVWQCSRGAKVVDMGCGPGDVLECLPDDVQYVGFDVNENYILKARERFGGRAQFLIGSVAHFLRNFESRLDNADLVLSTGLLHHLNDTEALEVFALAKNIMLCNGRFICVEPTFLIHQSKLSRWVIEKDRGKNIRFEDEWKELISRSFNFFSTKIATGLIRIPYTHIIIECRGDNANCVEPSESCSEIM